MINISSESLISISSATKHIPGRPHAGTAWRWVSKGLSGVKLESVKVGGRRFTSIEAIARFIAATTAASDGVYSQMGTPPNSLRSEQAERELTKNGL